MTQAFVCDAVRSPIGRFGGALATVRTDDLAAHPIAGMGSGLHYCIKFVDPSACRKRIMQA